MSEALELLRQETTKLTEDDSGVWKCESCGLLWVFSNDGPEENNYHFCCSCGCEIEEYDYMPEIDVFNDEDQRGEG